MAAEFDPYYTWLGIPPEEQPPHHYRLLGIRPLEGDREVITHAMDQRMAHLRTLQSGKHSALSQRLLNEVSAAAVILLDPVLKAPYDASLRRQLDHVSAPPSAPPAVPPPIAGQVAPPPIVRPSQPVALTQQQVVAIAGVAGALLLVVMLSIAAIRLVQGPVEVAEKVPGKATTPEAESTIPAPAPQLIEHRSEGRDQVDPPVAPKAAAPNPGDAAPTAPMTGAKQPVEEQPLPGSLPTPSAPPSLAPATPETPAAPDSRPPDKRLPTPEEIDAARAKVVEIFGDEGRQAVKPEQKLALAQRMSQVARETRGDLAVKYAVLDAARRLQAAVGEVELTLETTAEMAREFEEDGWELRMSTLVSMTEMPLPADKRDRLALSLVAQVDEAVAEEEFALAEEFARLAVKVGNRSADASVRRSVVQKRSDLTRLKDLWQAVEKARDTLATEPDDPSANLVVGKFLCLVIANFPEGIPHLAKSAREPFAAAARADQAAEQGPPEDAVKAGDAWYALAESVKTIDKELVPGALLRARHWYQRGVSQLSGIDKARVEKRIDETKAIAAAAPLMRSEAAPAKGKVKGLPGKSKRKARGSKAATHVRGGTGFIGRGVSDPTATPAVPRSAV